MKIKYYLLVTLLTATLQPAFGKCEKIPLDDFKNPQAITASSSEMYGAEVAIVKIAAVHTDSKPRSGWGETGTLDLVKIESRGKSLPAAFSIPYQRRIGAIGTIMPDGPVTLVDCETWDNIVPKPGMRLLGFFRGEGKSWVVPEMACHNVIFDVGRFTPVSRKAFQPLFKTRL